MPVYCGAKQTPKNRTKGGSNQCFKIGLKSGFAAGAQQGSKINIENNTQLNKMSKDVVRNIAALLRITNYSKMSKQQLMEAIVAKDQKTFSLSRLKDNK